MSWHEGFPKFILEDDEPVAAQVGDEPTHVLMPIIVMDTHEAFHELAVKERNYYRTLTRKVRP